MIQPEGPMDPPEIVETDLSKQEGMPTQRGSTLAGEGLVLPQQDSDQHAGARSGLTADVSFAFRGAGMSVEMHNRSAESSPTNRALAVSLTLAVSFIGAIGVCELLLGSMNAAAVLGVVLLIVLAGVYLALRVIAEPAPRRIRKTRTTARARRRRR